MSTAISPRRSASSRPPTDYSQLLKSVQQAGLMNRRYGYYAVKVTGALFHTQGGLAVDSNGRVKRRDGTIFPNLFAAGGAAAGVSGSTAAGYLSGNGLLTATVLGRLAGRAAAELLRNQTLK